MLRLHLFDYLVCVTFSFCFSCCWCNGLAAAVIVALPRLFMYLFKQYNTRGHADKICIVFFSFFFRCLTDGVTGRKLFIFFFTVPLLCIFAMNTVLYVLTWLKIRSEVNHIRVNLIHSGYHPRNRKTARRVAKSMSVFVAAFFIQWWAAGLYGAYGLFGEIPKIVTHAAVIFSNLGGVLNLCVYILVKRQNMSGLKHRKKWFGKAFHPESRTRNSGNNSDAKTGIEKCSVSALS